MQRCALFLISLATVAGTPLASAQDGRGSAPASVRVGLLLSLTGELAGPGQGAQRGAMLAVEEINQAGGVRVGGKRVPIELAVEDDLSTPEGSTAAANRLVKVDHVQLIAGGLGSVQTLTSEPIIAASKIPYVVNGVGSADLTRRTDIDTRSVFHYNQISAEDGRAAADFLAQVVRPRVAAGRNLRVAVLYQDTPFGREFVGGQPGPGLIGRAQAKRLPLSFVFLQAYPAGQTDFTTALAAVKATQPDVVVPWGFAPETAAILQQGQGSAGIKALWGPASPAVETPSYYTSVGTAGPYSTILTDASAFDTPRGRFGARERKFRAAYQARFGVPAGRHAHSLYDTLHLFKRAVEQAGDLRPGKLREAIAKTNMPQLTMPVVGGRIRFNQYREVAFDMFVTQVYRDAASGENRARIVWPMRFVGPPFQLPAAAVK